MENIHIPTEMEDLQNSDRMLELAAKGTITSASGRFRITLLSLIHQENILGGATDRYVGECMLLDNNTDAPPNTVRLVGTPAQILKAAVQEFLLQ